MLDHRSPISSRRHPGRSVPGSEIVERAKEHEKRAGTTHVLCSCSTPNFRCPHYLRAWNMLEIDDPIIRYQHLALLLTPGARAN